MTSKVLDILRGSTHFEDCLGNPVEPNEAVYMGGRTASFWSSSYPDHFRNLVKTVGRYVEHLTTDPDHEIDMDAEIAFEVYDDE